ncbi:MAG: hypothetical protein JW751_15830 [Polyangiaceae bacterium]|nr:hypothetical protein [Polyangiaceae bacterium]
MTGTEYRRRIARYITHAYGERGTEVFEEVPIGTSIIGKQRRLDVLVLHRASGRAFAVECKYQDSSGTVDEKIPYALQDLAALAFPGVVVYAGSGFSEGVLHLLQSSERAAYCLPDETLGSQPRRPGDVIDSGTWQLDHAIALVFGWWDVIIGGRHPISP